MKKEKKMMFKAFKIIELKKRREHWIFFFPGKYLYILGWCFIK